MYSHEERSHRAFIILVITAFLVGPELVSAEDCTLDLVHRSPSTVTIDGSIGSQEWGDAGTITSMDNCLDKMSEIGPNQDRLYDITVHSQRYTSGGQEYLSFAFEVPDNTVNDAEERIFLYFDADQSADSELQMGPLGDRITDHRLMLEHTWTDTPSGQNQQAVSLEWGAPGSSDCWTSSTADVPTDAEAGVVDVQGAVGYQAEIRVPIDAIGSPSSDIGIAFAVVDDHGSASATGDLKYAASFPESSLNSTNTDNPNKACNTSYAVPDNFGVGLWSSTRGAVYISRSPVFWDSEDIKALQCGEQSTYRYHPAQPCELSLDARVHNDRPADLDRHILYLWADHGASPSNWRFIDLQEKTIPGGGDPVITSEMWDQVPEGLAHHPCVRAYILPENLNQNNWSEQRVRNVSSPGDIQGMMQAYDLSSRNWAQKNISATAPGKVCPAEGCASEGGMVPVGGWPYAGWTTLGFLLVIAGALGSFLLILGVQRFLRDRQLRGRGVARIGAGILLVLVFACQPTGELTDDGATDEPTEEPVDEPRDEPADEPSDEPTDRPEQPIEPGPSVLLSEQEYEQFHEDHAFVQMRVFGIVPVENSTEPENTFYDRLGGVLRMLPIETVREEGADGIPVELQITNTEQEPRRLILRTRSILPPAMREKGLRLVFERGEQMVQPETVNGNEPQDDIRRIAPDLVREGPIVEPGQTATIVGRVVLSKEE